jgi:hypothetical protein
MESSLFQLHPTSTCRPGVQQWPVPVPSCQARHVHRHLCGHQVQQQQLWSLWGCVHSWWVWGVEHVRLLLPPLNHPSMTCRSETNLVARSSTWLHVCTTGGVLCGRPVPRNACTYPNTLLSVSFTCHWAFLATAALIHPASTRHCGHCAWPDGRVKHSFEQCSLTCLADKTCVAGVCSVSCGGGSWTTLLKDVANCGACGAACPAPASLPNVASVTCSNGTCFITSCAAGWVLPTIPRPAKGPLSAYARALSFSLSHIQ